MASNQAVTALAVLALAVPLFAAAVATGGKDPQASRELREARPLPPGGSVVVDNVWGSIEVASGGAGAVAMVATERVTAASATLRERARREVTLRVEEFVGGVRFYVDGPFRCPEGTGRRPLQSWRGHQNCLHWNGDYQVAYDFVLRVPADAALDLSTVNEGEVKVRGVRGSFAVSNVNGGIELDGMASAGMARTVNGAVRVQFAENPAGDSSFATVNGDVEVGLRRALAADVRLRTTNGEIFTEFAYAPQPLAGVSREHQRGRYVYKTAHATGIRIGSGGSKIALETFNGDLILRNLDSREN
jgi:hypothetical protein